MKLVSLNVGITLSNSEQVADFLRELNADIIVLQEVARPLQTQVRPQYQMEAALEAELAKLYPYSFFGPLWTSDADRVRGRVVQDFGGRIEQGNEVRSKFPIAFGSNEFFYRHFEYIADITHWAQEDHGRAVQVVGFNVDGQLLQVLNVHGIWTADKLGDARTLQACKYIAAAARRRDVPTIIAGDFNLLTDTASMHELERQFRNLIREYGIEATRPDFQDERETGQTAIDYVFVNDLVTVRTFEVVRRGMSDHFPLVLDFAVRERGAG